MSYATEDIIEALKNARETKGLSQRALSARTGVPQSHISKIENGGADIRLSSLVELARALNLELKLVPAKAIPAVDNVVRSATPTRPDATVTNELNRTLYAVKSLRMAHPDLSALVKLEESFQTFSNLRNISSELAAIRDIAKPVRELLKAHTAASQNFKDSLQLPLDRLKSIQEAASAAQRLRNQLVHNIPDLQAWPRPAYRLDGEEEDDNG